MIRCNSGTVSLSRAEVRLKGARTSAGVDFLALMLCFPYNSPPNPKFESQLQCPGPSLEVFARQQWGSEGGGVRLIPVVNRRWPFWDLLLNRIDPT